MDKRRRDRYRKTENRIYISISIALISIIVFFVIRVFVFGTGKNDYHSALFIGNPMRVYIAEPQSGISYLISIPSDVTIQALSGYGRYSLAALWKLGHIEKKPDLLIRSLSDFLAFPITNYYAGSDITKSEIEAPCDGSKFLFSVFTAGFTTNATIGNSLSLFVTCLRQSSDKRRIIDLTDAALYEKRIIPTGDVFYDAETSKMDTVLGTRLEAESIRREKLTIAVYNSTNIPEIAQKASRYLLRTGIHVTDIQNDAEKRIQCLLTGSEDALKSMTSRYIQSVFLCDRISTTDETPQDLRLYLGSEFADRYQKK